MEDRIHHLAGQYAIAVLAYAVMSNHVHLPIRLIQYLELVAWSGKVSIHAPPESSSAVPSPKSERAPVETLRTLFDCDPGEWLEGFTRSGTAGDWLAAGKRYANGWTSTNGIGCDGRSGAGVGRRRSRRPQRPRPQLPDLML